MTQTLSPTLARVMASHSCTGCGLCAAVSDGAIRMMVSEEGFLRPQQGAEISNETDRTIADTCPGRRIRQTSREHVQHKLWGPIVGLRSGNATDPVLRHHASSGGALSAIAGHLLSGGLVDRVVQTAASDKPLENVTVISRTGEEIYHAAGSRYAPSAPLAGLLEELDKPGRFALVGKPCDIAAARAYARHDARVNEKIPVMLSFFCAGVPSLKGSRQILSKLGVDEHDVVRFQYRGDGWPGRATAVLEDGTQASMSYADSWGEILRRHVQFRCKICADGTAGLADIVCADAWESDENGYPLFEEREGSSLIVTRTQLGENLVRTAVKAGAIETANIDLDALADIQPSHVIRRRLVASRLAAMAMLGKPIPRFIGFNLMHAARAGGFAMNIRSFLGTARRILSKRW